MRILLDIDCVLADFVKGACRAHGLTVADVMPHWPVGRYDMPLAVGAALGRDDWGDRDFWGPLDGSRSFWADLDPLPWAAELVAEVSGMTEDWWLVTSQSWCDECVPGKLAWCRKFLGTGAAEFDRMIPTRHKYLLAQPRVVLVDDYDRNCERFEVDPKGRPTGGRSIVFPAHHNSRHAFKTNPYHHVLRELRYLVNFYGEEAA